MRRTEGPPKMPAAGSGHTAIFSSPFVEVTAVVLSGQFELREIGSGGGASVEATIIAGVVAIASGYAAIAWLLRYLARHTLNVFVVYRILLGVLVIVLAATSVIN